MSDLASKRGYLRIAFGACWVGVPPGFLVFYFPSSRAWHLDNEDDIDALIVEVSTALRANSKSTLFSVEFLGTQMTSMSHEQAIAKGWRVLQAPATVATSEKAS